MTNPASLALFQQFRARYPKGGLTSELVRVQEQAFVVRVHLHLDDTTAVTALAADPTLEVAEDRARQRAFDLLGLSAQPLAPAPKAVASATAPKTTTLTPQILAAPQVIDAPQGPPAPLRSDAEIAPEMPAEEAELTPPLDLIQDPTASTAALPLVPSPSAQPPQVSKTAMAAPMDTSQGQTVTASVPMPDPIDLSDVIAQTDVELKRLAWSVKDGRDYLEQTYGKRSRHDLTDEELLAFLLHLESLPTPISS